MIVVWLLGFLMLCIVGYVYFPAVMAALIVFGVFLGCIVAATTR